VSETKHRYDVIFLDAFTEKAMPVHITTLQFFINLRGILTNDGCLATNSNVSTTEAFDQLVQTLTSTFEANILLTHIISIESARVIISSNRASLTPIISQEQAIQEAKRLETNVGFEFGLSRLLLLAYRGLLVKNTPEK
jgi:spermidine synthase